MAPINRMRTYKNNRQKPLPGSQLALNNLLANNLRKRLEISVNSPGISKEEPLESTFDRLLKGKVYNNVAFKKFPDYCNEGSASSIFSTSNNSFHQKCHDSVPNSSSRINIVNQSILNPVVILDRKRNEEESHSTQKNENNESVNIPHSRETDTKEDFNSEEESQPEDPDILELENTEKMLLMDSLQLQKTVSTYFNFEDSVCLVSTPQTTRNIYCLRKHPNGERIKTTIIDLTNSVSCCPTGGSRNSSFHRYEELQSVLEELSNSSRNGNIQGKHLDMHETQQSHQSEIIEVDDSIEPLPTTSTPLSVKNFRFPDQSPISLRSEALEIINEWSNRCPTPNSFNNSFQNRLKCKKMFESGVNLLKQKKDSKLFKPTKVMLKYVPHLENIIKEALKNSTSSVNLGVLNVRRISNEFVSRRKKRSSMKKLPLLKNCAVYLIPLKMHDLETSIESSEMSEKSKSLSQISESNHFMSISELDSEVFVEAESQRFSNPGNPQESEKQDKVNSKMKDSSFVEVANMNISGKHKCSKDCKHFKKIPWVILERCDFSKYVFTKTCGYSDMNNSTNSLSTNHSTVEFRGFNNSEIRYSHMDKLENSAIQMDKYVLGENHDCQYKFKANSPVPKFDCSAKILETNSNQFKIKDCFVILKKIPIPYDEKCNEPMIKENKHNRKSVDNCASLDDNKYASVPITNSLIEECDKFNESPLKKREFVSLAPGKKFRRSIMVHKKSLALGKRPLSSGNIFRRRHSIKLIPVLENENKTSELASLALNNSGYVSLRQSFRRSSLEEVENYLPNVQPIENYLNYIANKSADQLTARDIVLKRCGQTEPLIFEKCYPKSALQHCQKIGEGVFGEVFMIRDKGGSTTVMKVIPIEGEQIVNLEKQKTFEEIISEIIISMELSNLEKTKRNNTDAFVRVKGIRCVQGCYPDRLLELWELYDENKQSENDSPEMFLDDQLYIVIELANAGQDLEAFLLNNAQQALSVFEQITCALAVAESELQFEHRDLHWGNVLITLTEQKNTAFVLDGKEIIVANRGAKATIIDFTLSRVEYDGVIIFNDLSMDEDLFTAKGDYQFDIYRKMQENNGNQWQGFKPFSNILWLHYILDKALNGFRYKNVKSKQHRASLAILRAYEQKILEYNSATDFVLNNFINNVLIE